MRLVVVGIVCILVTSSFESIISCGDTSFDKCQNNAMDNTYKRDYITRQIWN